MSGISSEDFFLTKQKLKKYGFCDKDLKKICLLYMEMLEDQLKDIKDRLRCEYANDPVAIDYDNALNIFDELENFY